MGGSTKKTPGYIRGVHSGDAFNDFNAEDEADIEAEAEPAETDFGGGDGGGGEKGKDPPPFDHKLSAKRINECIKHFSSFANALGIGILGAAAIIPFVKDRAATIDADLAQWCAIGVLFHILPYVIFFLFMQSEE